MIIFARIHRLLQHRAICISREKYHSANRHCFPDNTRGSFVDDSNAKSYMYVHISVYLSIYRSLSSFRGCYFYLRYVICRNSIQRNIKIMNIDAPRRPIFRFQEISRGCRGLKPPPASILFYFFPRFPSLSRPVSLYRRFIHLCRAG